MKTAFLKDIFEKATFSADWTVDLPAGTAQWDANFTNLFFVCPCGCKQISVLQISVNGSPGWKWDGNKEEPTLTPSILKKDGCRWHGYLTKGEWKPC